LFAVKGLAVTFGPLIGSRLASYNLKLPYQIAAALSEFRNFTSPCVVASFCPRCEFRYKFGASGTKFVRTGQCLKSRLARLSWGFLSEMAITLNFFLFVYSTCTSLLTDFLEGKLPRESVSTCMLTRTCSSCSFWRLHLDGDGCSSVFSSIWKKIKKKMTRADRYVQIRCLTLLEAVIYFDF
jgi:hypothetical protein